MLASLLHSEYPFYEIIIVDNGSTDGSVSGLKRNLKNIKTELSFWICRITSVLLLEIGLEQTKPWANIYYFLTAILK